MTNKRVRKQSQKQAKQRRKLEDREAGRVKPWTGLHEDDYDFRSWAEDASKNCLRAGAVYEYARESWKLRCLLAVMNPQGNFETTTAPDGSREQIRLPCSFRDLSEKDAEKALGGWLYCLVDLSDYLASNISFGELFHTKRDELETALGGLDKLARVRLSHRHFHPVDAVTLAWEPEAATAVANQLHLDDPGRGPRLIRGDGSKVVALRQRLIRSDGSEVFALRIRWGGYTDKEIGAAMERFARRNRPQLEICKEPERKGRGREDIWLSALDNLSAMRLIRWCPIGEATRLFGIVRLNARGGALEQRKVRDQKAEAEGDFHRHFPFGENPANCGTFALSP